MPTSSVSSADEQASELPQISKISTHLPQLDGIRGIAISLVLLTHLAAILRSWAGVKYFSAGWIGVDLFFVLSGFLITRILMQTVHDKRYYSRFYIRRGLRIWPLYYVYFLVFLIGVHLLQHSPAFVRFSAESTALQQTSFGFHTPPVLYVFYLQNLYPGSWFSKLDVIGITWSLCIEEHFYLIWPWLVMRFSRSSLKRILWAALFLSPIARSIVFVNMHDQPFVNFYATIYHVTPFHMDAIIAGSLLALYLVDATAIHAYRIWFAGLFLCGAAASIFCLLHDRNGYITSFTFSSLAMAFSGLVGLSLFGWLKGLFTLAPLRYLGKISYGLYLLHWPIVQILQSHTILHRVFPFRSVGLMETAGAITTIILSLLIASLSFYVFEKPILSLKSRFAP